MPRPGSDDLLSSTMIRQRRRYRERIGSLVGPVSAAFLVERGSGETCEEKAITQYLYWCRLKKEEVTASN